MQTYIKIGQSVITSHADYAEKNGLDDETEYFPLIKLTIESIVKSYDGSKKEKNSLTKSLTDFVKELFIKTWITQAKEEEVDPDIEMETEDAIEEFNESYGIS